MPYKDPEVQKQKLREYHDKRVAFIREAKSVPCTDCGNEYPYYVMDFDHLRDKDANMNRLRWSRSIENIKKEIAKCEVVCANCHRVRTFERQAPLSQLAEDSDLKSDQCRFESDGGY